MTAPVKRHTVELYPGAPELHEVVLAGEYERLEQENATLRENFGCALDCKDAAIKEAQGLQAMLDKELAQVEVIREAFVKMRNVAAGYSNYCEDSASTRRLDRELEVADELYRSINTAMQTKP